MCLFIPPPPSLLISGRVSNPYKLFETYLCWLFLRFRKKSGPSVLCFVFKVRVKKPTHCFVIQCKEANCQLLTSFRINDRMFVDVILLNVFLDLTLQNELDVFYRSFEFFIVNLLFLKFHFDPIDSFCSYLILMSKRMQLIKEFVVGPASARSYIIGVVGNNWLVGWLVGNAVF